MHLKNSVLLILACALLASGCGKSGNEAPQAEGRGTAPEASAAGTLAATEAATGAGPAQAANRSEITTGDLAIVIKGSGSGDVGPISFDQPYCIVKVKYESPEEYSMLQVSYKKMMGTTEVEKNVVMAGKGDEIMQVFGTEKEGQPSKEFTFTVKSAGSYTIEFIKPLALDTAQPAPLTVTGGQGYTVTPLVKTAGNYVMLRFKYTAPVDAGVKGGMPLASGALYDAETGELWVKDQNVYNGNVQSQGGITRQKPGIYFALISCSKEGGTWEATITE